MIKLMLISNEEKIIKLSESLGFDRIFIDLEIVGKVERQGHLNTFITDHKLSDISMAKKYLKKTELLVRINPFYDGTKEEVEECIKRGADIIMLPMFKTVYEVEQFIEYVGKRAKICLLLETSQALVRINDIVRISDIDEIHVGLNDLHLSMDLDFMFELLSGGIVEYLSNIIRAKDITFGFGGIAKIGEGVIPAEMILGEHYRLGSQMAILSRTFRNNVKDLELEINRIRKKEDEIKKWTSNEFEKNKIALIERVRKLVDHRG